MFGNVFENNTFRGIIVNKNYLVLHAGPIGTRNQNSRPLPDLFQCRGLRFAKRATIGKLIFRSKLLCTILRAMAVYILSGLCFGIRAYPRTCLDD